MENEVLSKLRQIIPKNGVVFNEKNKKKFLFTNKVFFNRG